MFFVIFSYLNNQKNNLTTDLKSKTSKFEWLKNFDCKKMNYNK